MIYEVLKTKIAEECEVLVCGGGIAGISAALAASRNGKKVILLERGYMLGGLATAGLVTMYLPLCDGCGRQVSFGIAEELLRLSISMGAEQSSPDNWLDDRAADKRTERDPRFETQFNPQLFALLVERLLLQSNVDILYGSAVVGVSMQGCTIDAVVIENKSGRQAIRSAVVVDATGDCDVARFAGASTVEFTQGNVLAAWYYSQGLEGYRLNILGVADIPEEHKTGEDEIPMLNSQRFSGLSGRELSRMMQLSHKATLEDIIKRRLVDPGLVPTGIAAIPQIRMTRRIDGEYTLHAEQMHTAFPDSIGMIADWRKRGPVYEIPFSTLYSSEVKNLITAGRCISVSEDMWDISRVIPACAVTGQAAGTAASIQQDFSKVDISKLQEILRKNGVKIHENI